MRRIGIIGGLIMALAVPAMAVAATQNGSADVTLAKGDNRTGTYYVAGQTITVDGDVAGDVVCAGQTVVINGSVGGDVLCGAQTLTVNGPVGGSVRAGGQIVTVNGNVARNITVGAQNFVLGSNAKVGGDVAVGAQATTLSGPVGQSVYAGAETLAINSGVGGNVTAQVQSLSLGGGAALVGNLDYTSDNTFALDKSKVQGLIAKHAPARPAARGTTAAGRLGSLLFSIVATLLGALLVISLAPRLVRSVTSTMQQRWPATIGWGALAVIAGPIVLIVMALTVVGLPTALVIGMLWIVALVTSAGFAGVTVGRLILQQADGNRRGLALSALVGVPIVTLAIWLPWVGGVFGLAAGIWAVGGMLFAANRARVLG